MGRKRNLVPRVWTLTTAQIAQVLDLRPDPTRKLLRRAIEAGTLVAGDAVSLVTLILARSPAEQAKVARLLFAAGCDPTKAAATLGVSRSTLYRQAKG